MALNDLALGNLIDTGQTGGPDFKRSALLPLPPSSSFSTSTLSSFLPLTPLASASEFCSSGREIGRSVRWKSVSRGGGQREDDEMEETAERSCLPANGNGRRARRGAARRGAVRRGAGPE